MEKELQHLLQNIHLVKQEYDIIRNKEEKFNLFSVLHKMHDERRLHSRFISNLLDPYASHNFRHTFLNKFIRLFSQLDEFNYKNAIVYPQEWDKKEIHNIDILVIDRSTKQAIIIENKINASDSNNDSGGQLERYVKQVCEVEQIPQEQIQVFYLTLDGHEPSAESLGTFKTLENINGQCISYGQEIMEWLNSCLLEVVHQPFLREAILQYKKLIDKMTHSESSIDERKQIKDTIAASKETMNATKYLLENFNHVKWHTIDDFWKDLTTELGNNQCTILDHYNDQAIKYLAHYPSNKKEEDMGITFKGSSGIVCFIWHAKDEWLYWGFNKGGLPQEIEDKLAKPRNKELIQEEESYWWSYFKCASGEKLWLKDFSRQETFNLIDPTFRQATAKKVVEDIINFVKKHLE